MLFVDPDDTTAAVGDLDDLPAPLTPF